MPSKLLNLQKNHLIRLGASLRNLIEVKNVSIFFGNPIDCHLLAIASVLHHVTVDKETDFKKTTLLPACHGVIGAIHLRLNND